MLINRKWVKIVRVQENTDNWEAGSMTLAFYQTLGKELLALEVLWSPAGLLCWPPTKVNYLKSRDTGRRLCSSWWPEHIETSQNKDQKDSPLWKIMFLVTQLPKNRPCFLRFPILVNNVIISWSLSWIKSPQDPNSSLKPYL